MFKVGDIIEMVDIDSRDMGYCVATIIDIVDNTVVGIWAPNMCHAMWEKEVLSNAVEQGDLNFHKSV